MVKSLYCLMQKKRRFIGSSIGYCDLRVFEKIVGTWKPLLKVALSLFPGFLSRQLLG